MSQFIIAGISIKGGGGGGERDSWLRLWVEVNCYWKMIQ